MGLPMMLVAARAADPRLPRRRLPGARRRGCPAAARARRRQRGQGRARAGSRCRWASTSSPPSWPSWRWRSGAPTCSCASSGCCSEQRHLLVPLLPVSGLVLGLILLQPDFGTAVSVSVVVVAPAVGGRHAAAAVRRAVRRSSASPPALLAVSAPHRVDAAAVVPRPVRRRRRHRLPGRAGLLRAVVGRLVRPRPRGQPREVVRRPAGGAHRLRVRHHRRGARPARHAHGAAAVHRAHLLRRPHRPAGRRPVRAARRRRASPPGSPPRRSSTWVPSWACCRSPASRCRWCRSAGRRCSSPSPRIGMLLAFARQEPGAAEALRRRGAARRAAARARAGLRRRTGGEPPAPVRQRTADAGRPVPRARAAGRAAGAPAPRPAPRAGVPARARALGRPR